MSAHENVHNEWESRRRHVWYGARCKRCGMHEDWPGARHACEGIETSVELAERCAKNRQKTRAGKLPLPIVTSPAKSKVTK